MQPFHEKRRQQFLNEESYQGLLEGTLEGIELFKSKPTGIGDTLEEKWLYAFSSVADDSLDVFLLNYTAGLPIEPMRYTFEEVVIAYEHYAQKLREYEDDPDAMAFPIRSVDGYCPYIWLISLCYLLHRRDLLPRVAKLVDGENEENAGQDFIIEELLNYSELERYECNQIVGEKPFKSLSGALCTETNDEALIKLNEFLKRWYKDLKAAPWHDTHKNDAGYYGYWAFEAAAAVLLLDIEDDSSLHQYLYYPKDLVAFARNFKVPEQDISNPQSTVLRCEAGNVCPKTGNWWSPAYTSEQTKHFNHGDVMMDIPNNAWGAVVWYLRE